MLNTTKGKILQKIFGSVYNMETGMYERRYNKNLQNMYGKPYHFARLYMFGERKEKL